MKDIKQTQQAKEEFTKHSEILPLLLRDENITYEELQSKLGKSRREVSNLLSEASMFYALLSISYGKGHRVAKDINSLETKEDLENELKLVDFMINQTRSRYTTIRKKLKPLIAWKKVAEKKLENL